MQKNNLFGQFSIPISFGGAAVSGSGGGYGFGDISESDAVSLLRYAFNRGVEVFDSAPVYGFGMSEQFIGKAFAQNREKVFITSKSGVTWHDNMRIDMTNSPDVTKKMLEQSLRDLNTDYIDLFFIHWPDKNIDIRVPMEVLAKAKLEGKIKHIGLCNTNSDDLAKAQEVDLIEVVQAEYNFFNRRYDSFLLKLTEQDIPFMSYGTFDKGVLTGRVTKERDVKQKYDKSDCRSWAPWWKKVDRSARYVAMEKLTPFLQDNEVSLVEFALGFNLAVSGIENLICGMRTHEQVDSTINSLAHLPSSSLLRQCEQFYVN